MSTEPGNIDFLQNTLKYVDGSGAFDFLLISGTKVEVYEQQNKEKVKIFEIDTNGTDHYVFSSTSHYKDGQREIDSYKCEDKATLLILDLYAKCGKKAIQQKQEEIEELNDDIDKLAMLLYNSSKHFEA